MTEAAALKAKWKRIKQGHYEYPLAFRREYLLVLANETYAIYQLYLNAGHMIQYTCSDDTGAITELIVGRAEFMLGKINASLELSELITIRQFWSNLI